MALAPSGTSARPVRVAPVADTHAGLATIKPGDVPVIIQTFGDGVAGERAVAQVGGTVGLHLPLIDGLAATLPPAEVPALRSVAGVRAVTLDRAMTVQGGAALRPPTPVYGQAVRADDAWNAGLTARRRHRRRARHRHRQRRDLGGRIVTITNDRTGAPRGPGPGAHN